MSPPRLARTGDPFDRALLRAARCESPPPGAEDRALLGLGLSAGLSPHSVVGQTTGSISAVGWAWPLKAIAVTVALGAAIAGAWAGARPRPVLASAAPSAAKAFEAAPLLPPEVNAQAPNPEPSPPRREEPPGGPIHASRSSPRAPLSATRLPDAVPAVQAATVDVPPLSVEIALVQQAARALAGGEVAIALDLLDTYRRECPRGVLAEEAGVLRVQGLARSGRAAEAKALARQLLDAHPRGVLAARLRGLLDGRSDAGPL
jgi:hypothetical protein